MNKLYRLLKWTLLLTILAMGSILLGAGIPAPGKSAFRTTKQTNQKHIKKAKFRDEPFEVLEYRIKGNKVNEKENFEGGTRWLQGLSIKIKNKSENPITYIRISLIFPEALVNGRFPVYDYDIGHRSSNIKRGDPVLIIKDNVTSFELTDERLSHIEDALQKRGYRIDDLAILDVRIQEVHFANDTMWMGGEFYVADPNTRSGWRVIRR